MITIKAHPICPSALQSKLLVLSSPRNTNAFNFNPIFRKKSSNGIVTMACTRTSIQDPYTILDVALGASKLEIKQAYRHLALKYHPDVCKGDHCTTNFLQINCAYETLLSMTALQFEEFSSDNMEGFIEVGDDHFWEDWDEWIGWEGAWPVDYIGSIDNVDLTSPIPSSSL